MVLQSKYVKSAVVGVIVLDITSLYESIIHGGQPTTCCLDEVCSQCVEYAETMKSESR